MAGRRHNQPEMLADAVAASWGAAAAAAGAAAAAPRARRSARASDARVSARACAPAGRGARRWGRKNAKTQVARGGVLLFIEGSHPMWANWLTAAAAAAAARVGSWWVRLTCYMGLSSALSVLACARTYLSSHMFTL